MVLSDSIWKDCPDTGRSTGDYIVFYQGGPIDHCTNVPGTVVKYSAESEYNALFTLWMDLAQFTMINNELMNKDPYVVPEQTSIIIFDRKSAVCIEKNGKDTKHTRHISIIMKYVINGEELNLNKTV